MMPYALCNSTVTLYRKTPDAVFRTVLPDCYFQWQLRQERDGEGDYPQRDFLLIVPHGAEIKLGDRVIPGVGPENPTWEALHPAVRDDVGQIRWVKPYFLDGMLCHTEAGSGGRV